jgi:hypothetical protein
LEEWQNLSVHYFPGLAADVCAGKRIALILIVVEKADFLRQERSDFALSKIHGALILVILRDFQMLFTTVVLSVFLDGLRFRQVHTALSTDDHFGD